MELKVIREARRVRQSVLASLIGVSQPYLAHVENGQRKLSMESGRTWSRRWA